MIDSENMCKYKALKISENGRVETLFIKYNVLKTISIEGNWVYKIQLDNDKLAFLKDTSMNDKNDGLELLINFLGRVLHVRMAETYRLIDNSQKYCSLISVDVSDNDRIFYSFSYLYKEIEIKIKNNLLKPERFMYTWRKICNTKAFIGEKSTEDYEYLALFENEILTVIQLSQYIIEHLPGITIENATEVFNDFLKMCFFDLAINQVDRTMENYGVLCDKVSRKYYFAPLYDNSNISKPYICNNNWIVLNSVAIEKAQMCSCLIWNYYESAESFINIFKTKYRFLNKWINDYAGEIIDNDRYAGIFPILFNENYHMMINTFKLIKKIKQRNSYKEQMAFVRKEIEKNKSMASLNLIRNGGEIKNDNFQHN